MTRLAAFEKVLAPLFLAVVGACAAAASWGYGLGAANDPGSGYFPFIVSVLVTVLALIVALREGLAHDRGRLPGRWPWRQLGLIIGALVLFALAIGGGRSIGIPAFGLMPATFLLVLVSGRSSPDLRLGPGLVLAGILSVVAWLVFVKLLGLAIPLWPWSYW